MPTSDPLQSIADWYSSCIANFDKITVGVDSLVASDSGNHGTEAPQLVRDQIGSFRVWAANMGAHRMGRMSLDYKLREASHVHDAVLELLEELNGSLMESVY